MDSPEGKWAVIEQRDGTWVYRASALGGCLRALHAERTGFAPVAGAFDGLQTIFNEGHLHEAAVIQMLTDEGWKVTSDQLEVQLPVNRNARIVGHIDGIIEDEGGDTKYLLEVKALGESTFKKWKESGVGAFSRYAWQISVYMHALDLPGLFIAKNRNTGEIVRTIVEKPPMSVGEIKGRILKVEALVGKEPPACDVKMYPCPFVYLHEEERDAEEPNVIVDEEIDKWAGKYHAARVREQEAKEQKKQAWEKLEELLLNHSSDRVETREFIVANEIVTRKGVNVKQMELEHAALVDKYRTVSETRRAMVKKRKN